MRLARAARAAMIEHARAAAPDECCGLLIGDAQAIRFVHPARNASDAPSRRFVVEPQDHFDAIHAARAAGLDVVGAYHSHPVSAPVPSPTDRAESPGAGFLCVIVQPGGEGDAGDVRAWRLGEGNLEEVPLVPEP